MMGSQSKTEQSLVPQEVLTALESVVDPEIPVLTIRDLGILRDVRVENDRVVVTITPTYSGCPAMLDIQDSIRQALTDAGQGDALIETRLSPAWTTDWMSEEGREKLRAYGIAPPESRLEAGPTGGGDGPRIPAGAASGHVRTIRCPQCASKDTRLVSEFGSTACKAMYQCNTCLEPFDYFKCH